MNTDHMHVLSCKACGKAVNAERNDLCPACTAAAFAMLPTFERKKLQQELLEQKLIDKLTSHNEEPSWASAYLDILCPPTKKTSTAQSEDTTLLPTLQELTELPWESTDSYTKSIAASARIESSATIEMSGM